MARAPPPATPRRKRSRRRPGQNETRRIELAKEVADVARHATIPILARNVIVTTNHGDEIRERGRLLQICPYAGSDAVEREVSVSHGIDQNGFVGLQRDGYARRPRTAAARQNGSRRPSG